MRPRVAALAIAAGAAGGAAAALAMIGWAYVMNPPVGRGGEAIGLFLVLLVSQAGVRAIGGIEPGFARRLLAAAWIAVCAGLVAGLGAFLLYAQLKPALLGERYAALEATVHGDAAALARLASARLADLDPVFQAVSAGGVVAFFTLLLGAYAGFRGHVARRLAQRPPRD